MTMVPSGREETCLTLETHAQRLLPGIPDEVIMDHIGPKLSWRDLFSLSLVSRGWRHVFRSRQVYNWRVRSNSTETLVVMNFIHSNNSCVIVLCSVVENSCYNIVVPHLDGGIPEKCECLILDAKMYVLGGWWPANYEHDTVGAGNARRLYSSRMGGDAKGRFCSSSVHVIDLAGLGQWKKCAEMRNGRAQFACGVLNGKIYVFGGIDGGKPVFGSEVYDPTNDTWSPIQPMPSLRVEHRAAALGEEFVVHGGKAVVWPYFWEWQDLMDFKNLIRNPTSINFYHPVKDQWRAVHEWSHRGIRSGIRFTAQGKFYSLLQKSIHVYDDANDAWRKLHSSSFGAAIGSRSRAVVERLCVTFLDGELLAIVGWCKRDGSDLLRRESSISCLFRSKGFGTESPKIEWQKVSCSLRSRDWPVDSTRYFMFPVQL